MTTQEWKNGLKKANDPQEFIENNITAEDMQAWGEGDYTDNTDALCEAVEDLTGEPEVLLWGVSKGTKNYRGFEKTCDFSYSNDAQEKALKNL